VRLKCTWLVRVSSTTGKAGWAVLGSEQALALVRLLDSFTEGAWDKLLKTEGTFDFPSQTTIAFSFHKIFIGLSLYLKAYKPIFYKLKYEAELNLFSRHVASQLQHSCTQYTALDTSNTYRFPSFFLQIIAE